MPEYRRILLDGADVQVVREGDDLVAADGRRVPAEEAVHLPPCRRPRWSRCISTTAAAWRSSRPGCPPRRPTSTSRSRR
ncbi:hypothetical protein LUX57_06805 [Actinomadura madurae]|uniref:hypothetical protein n=1 Tax=Actinomadura madurae TaxID=1993 RepID=UPI0020D22F3F|nr:hypothetical protein [Actinomadura madurae]MCP9964880.1 hypothetical protein [Actinomadura madurae]